MGDDDGIRSISERQDTSVHGAECLGNYVHSTSVSQHSPSVDSIMTMDNLTKGVKNGRCDWFSQGICKLTYLIVMLSS